MEKNTISLEHFRILATPEYGFKVEPVKLPNGMSVTLTSGAIKILYMKLDGQEDFKAIASSKEDKHFYREHDGFTKKTDRMVRECIAYDIKLKKACFKHSGK